MSTMNTIGVIARRLGKPVHKIEYVIRSRGIQAIGMAGNARVFDNEAVALIASEVRRMDSAQMVGFHRPTTHTA